MTVDEVLKVYGSLLPATVPELPRAEQRPLLTVDELVELVPKLGRTAAYESIRRGEIPSIKYGRKVFIPTAALRRSWGLDSELPTPDA